MLRPPIVPNTRARILTELQAGTKQLAIAHMVGVSKSLVSAIAKGLRGKRKTFSPPNQY